MACPYLSELQEALLGKAFSVKSGYLNNKSSNLLQRIGSRVIDLLLNIITKQSIYIKKKISR